MNAAEALAPEQSVDEVRESLSVTEKGQPTNTIGNCRTVFCHDPLLRDAIRLNLLTDRVDIVRDLGWRRNTSALTDTDVKYLLLYFEQNYGLTSEKKMTAALSIVANENCYHPIQDVLNGLVWDGTPRIRSCLHHFLGAEVSDYVEEMLKHFLLGAIRRVFSPGSKYEEMLCLVGGQGAGKSSFFRLLAIRDEWFSDDLKKLDDDRVFLKLQGHWIIEMSEMLATSSAKSIEEIRSFISRQKETYRTPYEAQPKDRLRQCVFGGSSNTLDFLPLDRAGNRRFLPIMIYPENVFYLIIDRDDEGEETVHFLNQVDEADLMALTEDGEKAETPIVCTCTEKCQAGAVNTACPVCVKNLSECVGTEQKAAEPTEPENPEPEKKSNTGAILAVLLILAAGGGAAVYFLVLKPKQGKKVPADLDDFDLEDEEEYLTEDEETEEKNE